MLCTWNCHTNELVYLYNHTWCFCSKITITNTRAEKIYCCCKASIDYIRCLLFLPNSMDKNSCILSKLIDVKIKRSKVGLIFTFTKAPVNIISVNSIIIILKYCNTQVTSFEVLAILQCGSL